MIEFNWNIWNRNYLFISSKIKINVSKEKLWKIITAPGHLNTYHPFCEEHQVSDWDGVGCKDISRSYAGKTIKREVIKWVEGESYQIKMINGDGNDTKVKFEITDLGVNSSISVSIITNAYRNNPRPLWYPIALLLIVPSYKKYFNSLLNGMKYYSETGKVVARNQFGPHKQYSP